LHLGELRTSQPLVWLRCLLFGSMPRVGPLLLLRPGLGPGPWHGCLLPQIVCLQKKGGKKKLLYRRVQVHQRSLRRRVPVARTAGFGHLMRPQEWQCVSVLKGCAASGRAPLSARSWRSLRQPLRCTHAGRIHQEMRRWVLRGPCLCSSTGLSAAGPKTQKKEKGLRFKKSIPPPRLSQPTRTPEPGRRSCAVQRGGLQSSALPGRQEAGCRGRRHPRRGPRLVPPPVARRPRFPSPTTPPHPPHPAPPCPLKFPP
jgi:hypothetical protein